MLYCVAWLLILLWLLDCFGLLFCDELSCFGCSCLVASVCLMFVFVVAYLIFGVGWFLMVDALMFVTFNSVASLIWLCLRFCIVFLLFV